jgi:hypothetical protein
LRDLAALAADDRRWFDEHPHRRYRLRPATLADLPPHHPAKPGARVVVIRGAVPEVRARLLVGKPPHLRRDTDCTCVELVRRVVARGYTVGGKPFGEMLDWMTRELRP